MAIPPRLHFCWIGSRLPWAYAFAPLSAAVRSGMQDIVLHHTDELEDGPVLSALRATNGLRLHRLSPEACLVPVQNALALGAALTDLYARLASPVQRSDLLRAAILHAEGGVYLDLDTVTVAPLTRLLDASQFIGSEQIVWPHWIYGTRAPLIWAKHLGLDIARKALRVAPGGWRAFRLIQGWYITAVNNAVMGGEPGAPLFADALRAMAARPADTIPGPYELGPDLYQSLLRGRDYPGLVVHPPALFYPLPPEISEHWFRPCRRAGAVLAEVLSPETAVVHWYGSVRSRALVAEISPDSVQALADRQLFSALVRAVLSESPAGWPFV
jgi:hypothetical protein